MPGNRSRKETLVYRQYLKQLPADVCQFCAITPQSPVYIKEGKHFLIAKNLFPYSVWDESPVSDHLLLIPKHHTDHLAGLSDEAALEYMSWLTEYERQGYSSYARAPKVKTKSVVHQHTHLIKVKGKRKRLFMHIRKPYVRVSI